MNPVTVLLCVHSPAPRWDALLLRAVASLRAQTMHEFSTVIVLDECPPSTGALLSQPGILPPNTVTLTKPTPKCGLAAAKNFGLLHCDTEWVAFLDADDEYLPGKLQRQLEWAKQHPDISVWGTQSQVCLSGIRTEAGPRSVHGIVRAMEINNRYCQHDAIARQLLGGRNVITHGSVMIRRSVLRDLQGYRDVRGAEDYDLWKRALAAGHRFGVVPEPLYVWSYGESVPR